MNYALEKKGVYTDTVTIREFNRDSSSILFFEIAHIGTEPYYGDYKSKIDSIMKKDYFFYLESITATETNDSVNRKFIKLMRVPFQKKGYVGTLDSIFSAKGIKLKKKLINQPSNDSLALSGNNSLNVDVSLKEIVNYYESKYHPIILELCDFEVSLYEKPKCPIKLEKEVRDDIILNLRNNHVLENLSKEKRHKIAIIYGRGHLKGISEGLIKMGYIEAVK